MELKDAIAKAHQVLDEELASPTVAYKPAPLSTAQDPSGTLGVLRDLGSLGLSSERQQRPREVKEDASGYMFGSVNYNLLQAILSRLAEPLRPDFIRAVGLRMFWGTGCRKSDSSGFPRWHGLSSELPLVVEFLTRNGGKEDLLGALEAGEVEERLIPGHVLMLMQVEDMIALNRTVFSDSEYDRLQAGIDSFRSRAAKFFHKALRNSRGTSSVYATIRFSGIGEVNVTKLRIEIVAASDGIIEQCRKAKYFYLKGALLEGLNLEINQDKLRVEAYLKRFGFSALLAGSLDKADELYQAQQTLFDFKSCIGHLRSFLENLQSDAMPRVHAKYGGDLPTGWGKQLAYLLGRGVLSPTEERFASSFYALISDGGVHPLIAEREYARLARNMVIEYALMFLSKLEKLGLAPQ